MRFEGLVLQMAVFAVIVGYFMASNVNLIDSSVGRVSDQKASPQCCKGFLSLSTFSADCLTVSAQTPHPHPPYNIPQSLQAPPFAGVPPQTSSVSL